MLRFSVSIVILNWNTRNLLEKFLPEVVKNSNIEGVKIVVADNGSTDDSVEWLKENYPKINVIRFDENLGFAGGYNKALTFLDTEYVVMLNSDVAPQPGWLLPMVKTMKNSRSVAAVVPKIKDANRPDYFEYAGAAGGFIDIFGYTFCRGRMFNVIEKDENQYNQADSVFWGSGSALMVKTNLFLKSGGFDPLFFAHMEEIDWCWRVKNMGYKVMYVPDSEVLHLGGGTLNYNNPSKTYLNFRNNLFLIIKNRMGSGVYCLLIFRMCLDYLASIHFLFRKEWNYFLAVYKAHWSFIKKFRHFYGQRKLLAAKVSHTNHPEIYKGSVVFDFFVRKKRYFSQINHPDHL